MTMLSRVFCNAAAVLAVVSLGSTALAESAKPKNVILFIGDGMGHSQVEAAVATKYGAHLDEKGNPPKLTFEAFPVFGYLTTFSHNSYVTDSAAAGTALATGQKTKNGMLGTTPDGEKHKSLSDAAKAVGKSVGVLSSVGLNHATPAAFYAQSGSRGDYDEITSQVFTAQCPADVIVGGGIYRKTWTDELIAEAAKEHDIKVFSLDNMADMTPEKVGKSRVLAHFDENDNKQLDYATSRTAETREPRLADMTKQALDLLLARGEKGFFMMVEGGSIDWAGHGGLTAQNVGEVLELDDAVAAAIDTLRKRNELDDTLIVVTADHETGGLTLTGPYGKTLKEAGKPDVKCSTTNHSAIPVIVYAQGPGAEAFAGKNDNTHVYRALKAAMEGTSSAE